MSKKALKVTTKELQPRSRCGKRIGMHRRERDGPLRDLIPPPGKYDEPSSFPRPAAPHIPVMRGELTLTNGPLGMDRDPAVNRQKLEADEAVVRGGFRRKIRATIGRVPFVEDAVAAFYCAAG